MPEEPTLPPALADLAAATPEEIAEALSYALRFDERGKPRRGGWDFAAGLAAERLTDHLRRSGFVIMRARPGQRRSLQTTHVQSRFWFDLKMRGVLRVEGAKPPGLAAVNIHGGWYYRPSSRQNAVRRAASACQAARN
jgi:hypothetical protein